MAGAWDVARWLSRRFPHPYTLDDARWWIETSAAERPVNHYAIELDGSPVGGVGLNPHGGEKEGVAEFGYWLARDHWGRGIATDAARTLVAYAFERGDLRRLEAFVFAPNIASARVLEKCGFTREAICPQALLDRENRIVDAWLFAHLNDFQPGA